MKKFLPLICFLLSGVCAAQKADTNLLAFGGHKYYFVSEPEHEKLLIFLHGGVSNPRFDKGASLPPLSFLLEENAQFLPHCLDAGFNVLLPIKDDSLNWITDYLRVYAAINEVIQGKQLAHKILFVGGFSDGGTGAFKMFYTAQQKPFDGLLVFNGYPQHANFYKSVRYSQFFDKQIIFASSDKDEVIPYEFLMSVYAAQKQFNPETFFYLASGAHSFAAYGEKDIDAIFEILTGKNVCMAAKPWHGFIKNDSLVVFYPFRKSIVRKFNFGKEDYEINKAQQAELRKK